MYYRLIRKALKSPCRFKVAAMGVNHRGEVLGITFNSPRFSGLGGSNHAEITLLKRYGKRIAIIYICRVGGAGNLLPIAPCRNCNEKAAEMGIKIIPIEDARVLQAKIG